MSYSPSLGYPSYNPYPYQPGQMQQPFQAQNAVPQSVQNQGFVCRPVTSRAEAEVFQIPFDGSTTYFVDTANGKIYAKTFHFNDGTAPLVTYTRESAAPAVQYATVEDINALRTEIEALKSRKAVKKNDADE